MLGKASNEVDILVGVIQEVCKKRVPDDGMFFDSATIVGERIKEDADYEGVRLRFIGSLGTTRVHLQIDVGFADVVSPKPVKIKYPVILPFPEPELRSYPPESVVSEKLQAMIYLGSINSRMKEARFRFGKYKIAKLFAFITSNAGGCLVVCLVDFNRHEYGSSRFAPSCRL